MYRKKEVRLHNDWIHIQQWEEFKESEKFFKAANTWLKRIEETGVTLGGKETFSFSSINVCVA